MTETMAVTMAETTVDGVMEKILGELGGSLGVLLSGLGMRTGLWAAMDGAGPLTSIEVAARTSLPAPLVREWLRAQAAGGYLTYDPATQAFTLPEAVAVALLHAPGGAMIDACTSMFCSIGAGFADFIEAFRGSGGYGWDRRTEEYLHGSDLLTRTALPADLIGAVLDQVGAGLVGGTVADVGCGYAAPTLAVAQHFPAAKVLGIDYHDVSVAHARAAAAAAGLDDRVRFELAAATDLPGSGYALITFFDSLHDLGDPIGALAHARAALAPNGAVLLVEPLAADRVEDNLTASGRMFYAVSTLVCTPNALSQRVPGGVEPLGTLAGEPRLREVAAAAGFTRVRRIPVDAPLNLVLELRP
jgi:SAM-dependent methyltransferase